MGNTTSTPTVSHSESRSNYSIASSTRSAFNKHDGHHQPGSRPSTAGLPSSARSLRKMGSFSTLASSASRFYHHHSPSTLSLSSRPSKSTSSRRRCRDHDTILDIGKPTQFEHGIHVEYNKESGCYMVIKNKGSRCIDRSTDLIHYRGYLMCGNNPLYQVMISSTQALSIPILFRKRMKQQNVEYSIVFH